MNLWRQGWPLLPERTQRDDKIITATANSGLRMAEIIDQLCYRIVLAMKPQSSRPLRFFAAFAVYFCCERSSCAVTNRGSMSTGTSFSLSSTACTGGRIDTSFSIICLAAA